MRRTTLFSFVILAALVLPAGANAGKVTLHGSLAGQPKSGVRVTVQKQHGNLGKVTQLKFTKVAALCDDGSGGLIAGQITRAFRVSGNKFTKKTRVGGVGIDKGYFRASGTFRRGGKNLAGRVRFSFKTTTGAGCGTGNVRYQAAK